jgi:hypothetical protein
VIAIRVRNVVVGDEFILLRGIQREIPLLLLFGVLLGREENSINIFLERMKKKHKPNLIGDEIIELN